MKAILLISILFGLCACATPGTHVTDSPNSWITVGGAGGKVYWCESKGADGKPICRQPEYK